MSKRIKKGINIWSFPNEMCIKDCMKLALAAGFEGIELALSQQGELSLDSTEEQIIQIKNHAQEVGIKISGLATGLFWQYSMTSDLEHIRNKAKELIKKLIEIGALLGIECVLVCPGAVGVDFNPDEVVPDVTNIEYYVGSEIIDYEIAYQRAQEALKELVPFAEKHNVIMGVENIWNKFLLSPLEMRTFIDEIKSPYVQAYLDVGNMMLFGYPQHWIKILGQRIKKIHFKDFRRGTSQLSGFVDLLTGDVQWDEVAKALAHIEYDGWVNAEMCPPYKLYADQNIYNASAAMDRILSQK